MNEGLLSGFLTDRNVSLAGIRERLVRSRKNNWPEIKYQVQAVYY